MLLTLFFVFFFSSRRRHTRCALVTGVQTCALPISAPSWKTVKRVRQTWFCPPATNICRSSGGAASDDRRDHRAEPSLTISTDRTNWQDYSTVVKQAFDCY